MAKTLAYPSDSELLFKDLAVATRIWRAEREAALAPIRAAMTRIDSLRVAGSLTDEDIDRELSTEECQAAVERRVNLRRRIRAVRDIALVATDYLEPMRGVVIRALRPFLRAGDYQGLSTWVMRLVGIYESLDAEDLAEPLRDAAACILVADAMRPRLDAIRELVQRAASHHAGGRHRDDLAAARAREAFLAAIRSGCKVDAAIETAHEVSHFSRSYLYKLRRRDRWDPAN